MGLELLIVRDPCREVSKHRVRAFGESGGGIGRAPDNFWVLPDPKGYVSGQHCTVSFRDGVYWLKDVSRNGVFLNGSKEPLGRGKEVPLRNEDHLRLAGYELVVRLDKRPVRLQLPMASPASDSKVDPTGEHAKLDLDAAKVDESPRSEPPDAIGAERLAETMTLSDADRGVLEGFGKVDEVQHPEPRDAIGAERLTETMTLSDADRDALEGSGADHKDSAVLDPQVLPAGVESADQAPDGALFSSARSLVESAINRMRQVDSRLEDGGAHRFRASSFPKAVENNVSQREFKPCSVDAAVMERHSILLGMSDDAALRAFKILRTRLRRRMSANDWRSVGITGAGEGGGKTVTAINLAIAMAQDKRTPTFLVDMDLNRPQIGAYLGIAFDKGLSDYLVGEATIDEIIYAPGVNGLAVIPNGSPLRHASELLGSPRMAELVAFLESSQPNRTIIYDLPPILMSDDVLLFSPHLDCVLDVVAVGVTSRASLEQSKEVLSELNVIGIVLNRATEKDGAGHYYYY